MLRALLPYMVFLAISCPAAGNSSSTVTQTPESKVMRGGSVTLYCIFPIFSDKRPVKVHWWRDGQGGFLEESVDRRIRFYFLNQGGAAFKLTAARAEDAGLYYCRVSHKEVANGTGTRLAVYESPSPLQMVFSRSENGSAVPLTLSCKTAAYFPDDLNITWYKNGSEISTGMEQRKWQNAAGLYEASSKLTEIEPVENGTVYTCQVSHISLRIPANVSYTFYILGYGDTNDYPLICGCLAAGLIIFLILIFIVKIRGTRRKLPKHDQRIAQVMHTEADERLKYVTLNLTDTQKINKPRSTEGSTIETQMMQEVTGNNIVYATADFTGSKRTGRTPRKEVNAVYAQLKTME
ncbi:immunoglobulin lambda-1 light chain-like isoform X2 [Heterodontus francisci]|uniref:immunoglobulin lambda-1 light chain-like isoform X2 n=1 Tax=Heterodontus francisci TaxID=7792 RepID=UPI00355ADE09